MKAIYTLLILLIPFVGSSQIINNPNNILKNKNQSNITFDNFISNEDSIEIVADTVVITNDNIKEAILLWVNNPEQAMITYGGHVSNWDVSNVTSMHELFTGQGGDIETAISNNFNEDIGNWDVSNVTDMSRILHENDLFNKDLSNWDVSNVINMERMFSFAQNKDSIFSSIENWNVSNVENMEMMFFGTEMNHPIGNWDVSSVVNMFHMFGTTQFNQDISNWDVGNVENMGLMFSECPFNQPIGNWDVSNVTNMNGLFKSQDYLENSFNQYIGDWDVSNVEIMLEMFNFNANFNQDISNWNLENVKDVRHMFRGATSFDQNIGNWNLNPENILSSDETNNGVGGLWQMFSEGSGLSTENYDSTLIGFLNFVQENNISIGLDFYAGTSQYCHAASSRNYLQELGWNIFDAGFSDCGILGCTDPNADNFNPDATIDDGSCLTPLSYTCEDNGVAKNCSTLYDSYDGEFTTLEECEANCNATSIIEKNLNISIYPNPSSNIFNLEFNSDTEAEILVTNILGEQVYFESIQSIGRYNTQIDLFNYSKGVYNLTIKTSDGLSNHKLILQ